jgi:ribose 5-phosphate isomerase B
MIMGMNKTLALAGDHHSYLLKNELLKAATDMGWGTLDLGVNSTEAVDYPVYAHKVVAAIQNGEATLGVMICRTGVGSGMACNRFKGIRAAVCADRTTAYYTRLHNDANILCLGSGIIGLNVALDCLDAFLNTEWEGGRHIRRVAMLDEDLSRC